MGINEKLKEIKTGLPEFYDFMTNEGRGGWYDIYWHSEPIDFQIVDLENKIAAYLLKDWKDDRNDTEYAVRLGLYKNGATKDIFNADVYSHNSESKGSYRGVFGSSLKGAPGNFGEFEPDKQYDRIEKVELKDKQLIITVHAPGNTCVNSNEKIDKYEVDLDSVGLNAEDLDLEGKLK